MSQHNSETDQVAQNKAAYRRFQEEVFDGRDWRVETLARHLTADFIDHATGPWDKPGLEGVSERFTTWEMAFEEAAEANLVMVGEEDMLAVVYDLHARHAGDFLGVPASNRHVVIPGIEMLRLRDDKIAEHWGIYDFMATAAETGARLVFTPLEEGTSRRRQDLLLPPG